jgi:hypothetical protein
MTTAAAIVVQDRRSGWQGITWQARRDSDQVIYVTAAQHVRQICRSVVTVRASRPADERTRLTFMCHGQVVDGVYYLALGRGLHFGNLNDMADLRQCRFRKIVVKACGPIPLQADPTRPVRIDRATLHAVDSMHDFYTRLARLLDTEFIASDQQQVTYLDRERGAMVFEPWHGLRWVYSPNGALRTARSEELDSSEARERAQ